MTAVEWLKYKLSQAETYSIVSIDGKVCIKVDPNIIQASIKMELEQQHCSYLEGLKDGFKESGLNNLKLI